MNHDSNAAFFNEMNILIAQLASLAHTVCGQAENDRPVLDQARGFEGIIYQLRRQVENARPQYEVDYLRLERGESIEENHNIGTTEPINRNPILMGEPRIIPPQDMFTDGDESPNVQNVPYEEEMTEDQEVDSHNVIYGDEEPIESELQRLFNASENMVNNGGGIVNRLSKIKRIDVKAPQFSADKEITNEPEIQKTRLGKVD